jgi:hypothetical protein
MPKVDDFCSGILEDSPHDVDGYIMAVKKGGSRNDTDLVFGFIMLSQNVVRV